MKNMKEGAAYDTLERWDEIDLKEPGSESWSGLE